MLRIYLSLVSSFEKSIASTMAINAIPKLMANSFQADLIRSTVKFLINVPKISAGINTLFSSFDKTAAALSGKMRNFANMYPIIINPNRNAVWLSVEKKMLIIF